MWEAFLNIWSVKQQGHLHLQPNPQTLERKAWFTFNTSTDNLEDIWNSSTPTSTLWKGDSSPVGTKQIHLLTLFVVTAGALAWNYPFPPMTFTGDKARSTPRTREVDTYKVFLNSFEILSWSSTGVPNRYPAFQLTQIFPEIPRHTLFIVNWDEKKIVSPSYLRKKKNYFSFEFQSRFQWVLLIYRSQ